MIYSYFLISLMFCTQIVNYKFDMSINQPSHIPRAMLAFFQIESSVIIIEST